MRTAKLSKPEFNKDKTLKRIQLRSKTWRVLLQSKKGHIHVTLKGPAGYKRQALTSVKDTLTPLEAKIAAFHFYRLGRANILTGFKPGLQYVNYAEIFGSCFD